MSSKTVLWGACALLLSFPAGALAAAQAPGARSPTGGEGQGEGAPPPPPDAGAGLAPAPPAPTLPPVELEEVVVRLPRAEAAGDPTASATVVEAGRFAGEAKDVAALVATAPGVAVSEYGGLGQLATVSIRGSTADGVLVLIDGLPLNTAFGGAVDLSSIPRGWVERIEVLRGPEGALYGAGALGGVVNVVTRRAAPGRWTAEASGGSFGTGAAAADGAFAALGGTLLLAAAGDATSGRFPYTYDPTPTLPGDALQHRERENAAAWRGGALARFSTPAFAGRLDTLVQASAGRRGLPGYAASPTPGDWQRDGRLVAVARLVGGDPARLTLGGRLSARADRLDVKLGALPPSVQRGVAGGAGLELGWIHPGGRLTVRLDGEEEAIRSDGLGPGASRGSAGLGLADELLLLGARLRVAPALRLDAVGPYGGLSGKLGATFRLPAGWSVRASAGRTFRAPSLAELRLEQGLVMPNPDLVPEAGLAVDAALAYDGPLGLASLGGHVTRYRDLIIYEPTALGRLKPYNTGQALSSGLEAEAATAPLLGPARITLSAAWTLLHTELLRGGPDEVGHQIPLRARQRLFARAGASPGPLQVHLEAHYVGRRYLDRRNVEPVPATLVWNAGAGLLLDRALDLHLQAEVRNLADDRTLTDGLGNPLPSRMVMVTLRAGASTTQGSP